MITGRQLFLGDCLFLFLIEMLEITGKVCYNKKRKNVLIKNEMAERQVTMCYNYRNLLQY